MKLNEMPQIISSSTFGFESETLRNSTVADILAQNPKTIFEDHVIKFLQIGSTTSGTIAAIDDQNRLMYYVEYRKNSGILDDSLTQILVWRDDIAVMGDGSSITEFVFFKLLLPRFGVIASDRRQTPTGKKFWLSLLSKALVRGLKIGLYDADILSIVWYTNGDFRSWLNAQNAWTPMIAFKVAGS